ncbi:hypothetical protein EJB05_35471 [Eragrostis curvula]|uniref:Cyanobacterial aminoacyl-tRNA synthetase CAAD domain-containing protein n=1 Tax=Eragrostis curvula TaxID=38414 RepID=A0A5J9U787_9POAL|nr:hypothetical protein EJB05_35471 [Eragrostis curvula]
MHMPSGGCGFAAANCSFLPVATALRLPSATLSGRSAGCWRSTSKRQLSSARASTDGSGPGDGAGAVAAEASTVEDTLQREDGDSGDVGASAESSAGKQPPPVNPKIEKELKKAVQKTAATFAPRASTKTKNPAVPGTALYTVFEVQGYASMLVGGALSFNLVFPSNEPDIWRLMGMWSIWMFSKYCCFLHDVCMEAWMAAKVGVKSFVCFFRNVFMEGWMAGCKD